MSQQKTLAVLSTSSPKYELVTSDIPKPSSGEVLIKVEAAALNPVDWKIQKYGLYSDVLPAVLGSDIAGEIVELGEGVSHFSKDDKV